MDTHPNPVAPAITRDELYARFARPDAPVVINVCREPAFQAEAKLIPSAIRVAPERVAEWALQHARQPVVVYCVHGHEVSQTAAQTLIQAGFKACYLEGGIEGWKGAALPTIERTAAPGVPGQSRWVTRERPKIDRIACPWLIKRFIDPFATFVYVPKDTVVEYADKNHAIPYDIPGVQFSHRGDLCSFDALLADFALRDPALDQLATIVRGADTDRLELAPQAAGLLAISLGLSANEPDDHAMLARGMVIYDALYAWCRSCQNERHDWTYPS